MLKRLTIILLGVVFLLLMNIESQAQPKKLKFPFKNIVYEGIIFAGNFETPDSSKGDYYGLKGSVRFSKAGESKKEKQFFLGPELMYVPYKFHFLDSSLKGGGEGHITEGALSGQWFRFKETSITSTKFSLGIKYITDKYSYKFGGAEYERLQTNWMIFGEVTRDVIKTTGLINKISLGARYEVPFSKNKGFQARKIHSDGTVSEDNSSQPVDRREFRVWFAFGPTFPFSSDWAMSVLMHTEIKYKWERKQTYFPLGGAIIFHLDNTDLIRFEAIPEFSSKEPKPRIKFHVSADMLTLVRNMVSNF